MSRLRLVTPADGASLAVLLEQSRTYLAPWEPIRPDSYFTADGQQADLEAALERHARGDTAPFVILDDDGAVAGRLTLSGIARGPFQSCAMGYWVAQTRAGRGLATDAVAAALKYAFTTIGLHRVQAETLLSNHPSQRVLQRNGFERYGLAPRYLKIAGIWQDHLMFQRVTDDA